MTWKTWGFESESERLGLWENPSVKIRFTTNAERPPIRDQLGADPSCFRADSSLGERRGRCAMRQLTSSSLRSVRTLLTQTSVTFNFKSISPVFHA